MLDAKWIGHELPPSTLTVDRTRLQFFAKVIGETDPVYANAAAAQAAGHPDVLAPLTFVFAAELDSGATRAMLDRIGLPIAKLLHGEQRFQYHRLVHAGDTITVRSRIADITSKKNGALEFVTRASTAHNQRDELVAELRSVLICRNDGK